jgi:hypothetical protein
MEDDFDREVPIHVVGLTCSDNELFFFLLDTTERSPEQAYNAPVRSAKSP